MPLVHGANKARNRALFARWAPPWGPGLRRYIGQLLSKDRCGTLVLKQRDGRVTVNVGSRALRGCWAALLVVHGHAFAAPARVDAPATADWAHRIEPGDTLIGLQARLLRPGASWRALQQRNRIADPRRLRPGSTLLIPLALLREVPGSVEVLHVHGQVWLERQGQREDLAAAALLRIGDVVVTGAQSSASLRFADGSRTGLGANSRLRIERHVQLGGSGPVDTRLRLDAGNVTTQVPPARPTPRFEIRTPVINLGVRGTEFRTRVDTDRTTAEVLQGRVAIGSQPVQAGYGAVADARGVGPARALPAAPDVSAVPALLDRLPLRLPLPAGAQRYRLQLADAREPLQTLFDGLFDPPWAQGPSDLPDGRYTLRLRVASADGLEGVDASRELQVAARPEPPFLLRPRAGQAISEAEVAFAWARNPEAAHYRLQVAGQAGFEPPLLDLPGLAAPQAQLALPLGAYRWRVVSVRANGQAGPWSDAQGFSRVDPPPPPPTQATQPTSPAAAPANQPPRLDDDALVLRWAASALPGASYQVQVARDAAFEQTMLDERTRSTEQVLARPEAGVYHVRVRVIDADGRPGAFGAAQVIEVPSSTRWQWLWLLPLLLLAL